MIYSGEYCEQISFPLGGIGTGCIGLSGNLSACTNPGCARLYGAKVPVEFGAKIAVSLVVGYLSMERLFWDAFYDGTTFQASVERYREHTGVYPKRALTDKAYRTRENLQYCKERGIRLSGPKLGRPPRDKGLYHQQLLEERMESSERSAVESAFGVGKRRNGLNLIMEWLKETSEVSIHICILTMNLWRRLTQLLFALLWLVVHGVHDDDCADTAA